MADYVSAPVVRQVRLSRSWVLGQTWALYKRLFTRSLVLGAILFGVVRLLDVLGSGGQGGSLFKLLTLMASIAAGSLLQGGLVEIVRGLHVDGDDEPSLTAVLGRANDKLLRLAGLSVITGVGVGVGLCLFVVPGLVLLTWWAVAVPVAMTENVTPFEALGRSRAIVRGHGWTVLSILLAAGAVSLVVMLPFVLLAGGHGLFAWWIAMTVAGALVTPYLTHALTVVYYALVDPLHPIVQPPGSRDAAAAPPVAQEPEPPSIDDEYQRRFDERQQRWGD
jgi:hypothetical protein